VVRIDVHWWWFEYRRPGTRFWYRPQVRVLDTFIAEAARLKLDVLATVMDTPCWASPDAKRECRLSPSQYSGDHPPADPRTYAAFLGRLIAHVGKGIQYYEIWNEPNLPRFWMNPDPVAYTRLLKPAYRAIKSADPSAQVLAGATSGGDTRFIDGMYRAGARGFFDALSIHPYSPGRSPEACSVPRHSFECGVEAVHRLMAAHGDTRPLWLTEFGASVSKSFDAQAQARYARQCLTLIHRWSYVRGAVWYELYDDPTGHDGEHFGLFRGDLSARPVAAVFKHVSSGSAY
jgi:hypothetical protein